MLSVSTTVPAPDSLAQMLVQAINAQDHTLLEEVLHYRKTVTVEKTLSRLPLSHIVPLIQAITEKLNAKPSRGSEFVVWLRQIFITHRSYLLSTPNVASELQPLHALIESQLQNHNKLTKLQGKLELLLSEKRSNLSEEEEDAPLIHTESDGYDSDLMSGEED